MLKSRAAVLAQYHSSLAVLEAKQAQLLKYQSKPGKEDKAATMETECVEAEKKVDEDLGQLQLVTDRVFSETARFRREKKLNFKHSILDFVRTQVDHSRKVG